MPVRVRKKRRSEKGKAFKIVEASTGKVKGQSATKRDAEASARVRNQATSRKRRKR